MELFLVFVISFSALSLLTFESGSFILLELDRYDENLCADIQKRLDSKLKERNMSISEKSIFVNINFRFFVNIHDFFYYLLY